MVGFGSRVMVTSSNEAGQVPFEMVQRKIFAPTDKPLTVDVGDDGVIIVPVPEINVHVPFPIVGALPASDVLAAHNAWSGPAFAVVGFGSRMIITWSLLEGQVPFEIVH